MKNWYKYNFFIKDTMLLFSSRRLIKKIIYTAYEWIKASRITVPFIKSSERYKFLISFLIIRITLARSQYDVHPASKFSVLLNLDHFIPILQHMEALDFRRRSEKKNSSSYLIFNALIFHPLSNNLVGVTAY